MKKKMLSGKAAIVTGGGTGIGRAIAHSFCESGASMVINGRRSKPLADVVRELESVDGECLAVTGDVSNADDVQRLVAATLDAYGRVDIVVNNAGIGGGGFIHDHDIETWDRVMAVNLRGPFLLARATLPHMRRQGQGHIINISSESGLEYYPGNGGYGVSKHALNALGEYIQRENQEQGIRVDTVCPGMVLTPMSENSLGLNKEKTLLPDEIAELVLWLVTRRQNIKIGRPVLIQTMENPWI